MLWDALVVTYSSGRDKLQIFNLHVRANDIKQNNNSLEDFWISLQGVWGEIDIIDPNPMKCPKDIKTYSKIKSEQKHFQFLNALDRRYEPIKREILWSEHLPSTEAAYAIVRKEAAHQNILGSTINETQGIAAGLIATETEGLGLVSKVNRWSDRSQIGSSPQVDKSKLKCGECGMTGHTKEGCFRLVGYPDWWTNGHKKGTKNSGPEKGKASIAGSTKENSDTTNQKNLTGFGGMINIDQNIRLYYVDEVTQNGVVMLSHGTTEREAWLCPKTRHMFTTMNCDFLETEYYYATQHSSQGESECLDTLNWLRYVACGDERSHSTADESHLSTQLEDHVNVTQTAPNLIPKEAKAFVAFVYSDEIPANTEQALKSRKWKKAMEEEMEALIKKQHMGKMCLATWKENYQVSMVAKINTIRVLCSVAANKGWPLHKFDVKNAFLHGELKEEVYMEAPHGFTNKFGEREVCLLKKSLYGLKQSPRAWVGRFTLAMKNHGFKQSNSDHTLFLKQRGNLITCLIIYVDDMIVTGDGKEEITKLKKYLFTEFEMKDLGRLKYFLGIEVLRSKQGIFMCQKELADKGRYQRMVGKLIYLSHTGPDIAYDVGVVSQFMHQPQKNHMKAVMRILRYLKGTMGHGVLFKPNGHLVTQLYTDADWAGDKGNRRSTPGYFTIVGGNLVTWRSKKQKVVSLSSAEAEF
nr:putative ribonuclease H-like domain-containing protein [Tanacetum cinerariifolium]